MSVLTFKGEIMAKAKAKKTGKKDRKKLWITLGVVGLATICAVIFVVVSFFKTDEPWTYGFSGCVYADGEVLAGAKVSCGVKQTETDENGFYSFDGLTSVVEVSVSKDNYIFGKGLVYVNDNKENVDFHGYELFSLTGVVRNGDEVVPNAQIEVVSENGTFVTRADAFGNFYLQNMAGNVELNAFHDSINLFSQTFDKSKKMESLVVTGTTQISGRVNCDSTLDRDFQLKLNDSVVPLDSDLKFSIDNVSPNSVLTLSSENYFIKESQVRVTIQNGEFNFVAEKFYDITGRVLSGNKNIAGARIVVGNKKTFSDEDGEFNVHNLHGNNIIKAYSQGFTFDATNVTNEMSHVDLNGTFSIKGRVEIDDNGVLSGILVGNGDVSTRTNFKGEFQLSGLELGDIITVSSDQYQVSNNDIVLDEILSPVFKLNKIYAVTINVSYAELPLDNVMASIGGQSYDAIDGVITISGLVGNQEIVLSCDGYVFAENINVNCLADKTYNLSPFKIFTLSGTVKSGDIVLEDCVISVGDRTAETDEDGEFEIDGLYNETKMYVSKDGYNSVALNISISDCVKNVNLTYDIHGKIECGDTMVDGVKVSNGDVSTYSQNGEFSLSGLSGENTISFQKDYYTFSSKTVSYGQELDIDCTYRITGKVSNKQGDYLSNITINLQKGGEEKETTTTDSNGAYSFDGLYGEYGLYCQIDNSENAISLLPTSYAVSGGGIYNFSNSGYKLVGKVTSGGVPVSGVTVRAGELSTVTNNSGEYKFDLLIKEETLVLSKDGYSFDSLSNVFDVSSADENTSVDFECTYTITGVVSSGDVPLEYVKIVIADNDYYSDENGAYTISGLSGNNAISFELDDYNFDAPIKINHAGNYDISAMFSTTLTIRSGDVAVVGAKAQFNDVEYVTDENGMATVHNISIGDSLAFTLDGYNISTYTFAEKVSTANITATYRVSGVVYLTTSPISGVTVKCGEKVCVTSENGSFAFENVVGRNTITFEKTDLLFEEITIFGYQSSLTIKAKYVVTGTVSCAGLGLQGVEIVALGSTNNVSTITDEHGAYRLELDYATTLEFTKTGYRFAGEYSASDSTTIDVVAMYKVGGRVVSGDISVAGAEVLLSDGTKVTTDDNGYFLAEDIEEGVSFVVTSTSFNAGEYEMVYGYTLDIVIPLTYNVTINLSGITSLSGVSFNIGGETKTENVIGTQIFSKLSGTKTIAISKDGYFFSPSQFGVNGGKEITVVVKKEFAVSGYITTKSGVKASGVTITAGTGKTCITDGNGYYRISGLIDTPTIKLEMSVIDTAWQGSNFSYSQNLDQVSTDSEINTTIPDEEYAYYLFKNGYQKLNDASSYQIFGSGTVVDSASGEDQYVHIVYKKDTLGNRIIQNLNWHDGKVMGIVDPRIAQLTYVDATNKVVKYQTIDGSKVSNGTAEWKTSWTNAGYNDYLNGYGVNAEGYYPYVINQDTIDSVEGLALNDGMYTFTLKLATTEAMYGYYTIQMSKMCSSQTFQSFSYCYLTYTIGQDGFIRTMGIDEVYNVKASFINATVTDKFTYTFKTTSMDDVISDIKIDTVDNIKASLLEETPTKATNNLNIAYCKTENSEYNIYSEKRRKFL